MKPAYLTSKIFLDSGDPAETREALRALGFLDGQTTNPSLIAKNPHISELKASGALTDALVWDAYRSIAEQIHETIPNGSVSAEVYADMATPADEMITKGRELAAWFPGIFVKLPITRAGLEAAEVLSGEGININMTLCFTQEQAAAVHAATRNARGQVYVSPFIGRLDDRGEHGIDVVKNIIMMYRAWGSRVQVLAASIRGLEHLFASMIAGADIITAPIAVLQDWSHQYGIQKDPSLYPFSVSDKKAIPFRELPDQDWVLYDIDHELTRKGIEKFATDWKSLLQ